MEKKRLLLIITLFILLIAGRAFSETAHYYDQDGNVITSAKKPNPSVSSRVQKYAVPEGIELQKDINHEYYLIFGKNFSEIVKSIEENSIYDRTANRRFPTKSEWSTGISYNFSYSPEIDEDENTVRVTVEIYDIKTYYDITITLPALIDDTSLVPFEKTLWKNYFQRLLDHEYDHVRIIKDQDLKKTLSLGISDIHLLVFEYKDDVDIEAIVRQSVKEETEKLGQEWAKQIKNRNEEYDKVTSYGEKSEMRESFFKK